MADVAGSRRPGTPEQVQAEVTASGLRGRGGAGFRGGLVGGRAPFSGDRGRRQRR